MDVTAFPCVSFQRCAEMGPSARNSRTYGADGYGEDFSDFVVAESLQICEDDGLSEDIRYFCEGLLDFGAEHFVEEEAIGEVFGWGGGFVNVFVVEVSAWAGADGFAVAVDVEVGEDAEHPGFEVASIEAVVGFVGADHGFLGEVAGVFGVAGEAQCGAIEGGEDLSCLPFIALLLVGISLEKHERRV